MTTAIVITFLVGAFFMILSVINAIIGHCHSDLCDEWWENEKCEKLHYIFLAPMSALGMVGSVILIFIKVGIETYSSIP